MNCSPKSPLQDKVLARVVFVGGVSIARGERVKFVDESLDGVVGDCGGMVARIL